MKLRIRLFNLSLVLALGLSVTITQIVAQTVAAQAAAKVTVLTKSGDKLAGQFVAVTAEQLELETAWGGRVNIRAAEIADWQTSDDKVREQLTTTLPKLKKDDPRFVVDAKEATQRAVKDTVATEAVKAPAVTPTAPKNAAPKPSVPKSEAWQRSVDFAYSMARGNVNASELNGALSLSQQKGSKRFAFTSFGRNGVRNGSQTANLLSATTRYERTFAKLPAFTETVFEIDAIKQLDYRVSENVGLTLPVMNDDENKLSLDFGTGFTREEYNNGRELNTASSLLRASASQKLGEKAQLSQRVTMFSDLMNLDGWRLQTDVSLTMPLTRHLALRVSGLNRFDNRPFSETIKRNDFSLLTGFKINF